MRNLIIAVAFAASGCVVSTGNGNSCSDGVVDGNETDIDCGGSCAACGLGRRCLVGSDCTTGNCAGGICQGAGPSCNDGVRDGAETDVDCGGGGCPVCGPGRHCLSATDCNSGVCTGQTCQPPSCSDGVQNGDETGIDCGGSCPTGCHTTGANEGMPDPNTLTVYRIAPGQSAALMPGSVAGYAITANLGGSYRIVWTGDDGQSGTWREFWGTVWTPGHFSNLVPGCSDGSCALENGDYVSSIMDVPGGQAINWDTFAASGIDGFDFVTDLEPVIFDFFIDGARYTDRVYFFSTDNNQISHVGVFPFGLTTN